jgi:hypothetical protein
MLYIFHEAQSQSWFSFALGVVVGIALVGGRAFMNRSVR